MQPLDLIDRALRIHAVDVRGNNVDLVHAAVARFGEVGEVAAIGEGRPGRDPLGAGLGVYKRCKALSGVLGGSERGEAAIGEVGFVEEFEVGWRAGRGDLGCGSGDVTGVHTDGDLSGVKGARETCRSCVGVVVRVLREGCEREANPVGDVVAGEGVPDSVDPAGIFGSVGVEDDVEEAGRAFTYC